MIEMSITADLIELARRVDKFKKSLPRRTSFAMNKALFDVRNQIINRTYVRAFTVRNKRFARFAFRVDQARAPKLVGRVYDKTSKDYLVRNARGGTKLPRGTFLAVPVEIKRTATGKIPKGKQPEAILQKPNVIVIKSKAGQPMIAQRFGRRGSKRLRILYFLVRQAKIPQVFDFDKDANRVASRQFPIHWEREIQEGMRRAFPSPIPAPRGVGA